MPTKKKKQLIGHALEAANGKWIRPGPDIFPRHDTWSNAGPDGVSQVKRSKIDKNRTHIKSIGHLCQINRADDYLSIVFAGRRGRFEVDTSTGREIYLGIS